MVQFAYTILYVPDVAKSIAFYESAFGFSRKFVTPENDYGELSTGATTLAFAAITLAQSNLDAGFEQSSLATKPFGIELGFTTHDVAAAMPKAVDAGATVVALPTTKPWGQTVAYLRDLDGFLIELCTPVGY